MMEIDYKKGYIHKGDTSRIKRVMAKAKRGEPVTVAFLGGSITQGSLASSDKTCYAYRVYEWWQKTFQGALVTYINAGVGGTGSDYGSARVEEHVLSHRPDFILTEFCVNDCDDDYFKETFEGLIRHILKSGDKPALMLLNNAFYDSGRNAENIHLQIERHYDVPTVSVKHSVWPLIETGQLEYKEVSPDGLHPNDFGHSLVAGTIISALEDIYASISDAAYDTDTDAPFNCPEPLTLNTFEQSVRYNVNNSQVTLNGFQKDLTPVQSVSTIKTCGFYSVREGDFIEMEAECESLLVQYIKSVKKPAPIAVAVVDGDTEHGVILDANFTEDWGDCLYTAPILLHKERKLRKIKITIINGAKTESADYVPFYLVSVIGAVRP